MKKLFGDLKEGDVVYHIVYTDDTPSIEKETVIKVYTSKQGVSYITTDKWPSVGASSDISHFRSFYHTLTTNIEEAENDLREELIHRISAKTNKLKKYLNEIEECQNKLIELIK